MTENIHLSMQQQLETQAALKVKVKHNRDVLMSILKIVVFCGKQNIALRGHRETLLYGETIPMIQIKETFWHY